MSVQAIVILVTAPDIETARTLAKGLVENALVACVNLIPEVESLYYWDGVLHQDAEVLMLCKSTDSAWPKVQRWLQDNHPYTVPEMLTLPVSQGDSSYLTWLQSRVGPV